MKDREVFAAATAERLDVADLLESFDFAQLASPSLCVGWDTFTVAAHLAVTVSTRSGLFMASVIRHGGNVDRANDRLARRMARRPPSEVIDILRLTADLQLTPPRAGPLAALTDVLVHSGDIRRPLLLPHDPPGDRVYAALEFLTGPRTLGFVRRRALDGIRIVGEDVDFTFGAGEAILGRGADVMMAVCGRQSAFRELRGRGVNTLRSRLE